MTVRRNIPGVYSIIQDGNLRPLSVSDLPKTFVIGTASDGPGYTPVAVGDVTKVTRVLYGGAGSIVSGLRIADSVGAQSIFSMRINSSPASLAGVGGPSHKIQTVLEDASAGSRYKVAYDASVQRLQVIDANNIVVYDNDPAGIPVDLQQVIVRGIYTNATTDIGTVGSNWITMADIGGGADVTVTARTLGQTDGVADGTAAATITELGTGITPNTVTITVAGANWQDDGAGNLTDSGVAVTNVVAEAQTENYTTTTVANDTINFTLASIAALDVVAGSLAVTDDQAAVETWTDNSDGTLTPAGTGTIAGVSGTINYDTGVVALVYAADVGTGTVQAIATYDLIADTTIALSGTIDYATGAISLIWDTPADEPAVATDIVATYDYGMLTSGIVYVAGKDGTDASLVETYESLKRAFLVLESVDVDSIIFPDNVTLDAPNVADLSAGDITTRGLDVLAVSSTYPTKGSAQDVLGKVFIETYNGVDYYFWDLDGDGTAEIIPSVSGYSGASLASGTFSIAEAIKEDNAAGSGTVFTAASFNEVNLAWEAAYFCYVLDVNDNNATTTVGVEQPLSYLPEDLISWIGTAPSVDLNGAITGDGSGLLGNKFMVGTLTHGKGFWATEDGFLPGGASPSLAGNVIVDGIGNPVDIGKYLSITSTPVVHTGLSDILGVGTSVNMARAYGAYYTTLDPATATTNSSIPGVAVPFTLNKRQVEKINTAGYVTLFSGRNGLVVVEDKIAATSASDYKNLTTSRIVTNVIEGVRDAVSPFIGRGMTSVIQSAIESAGNAVLAGHQSAGRITSYNLVSKASAFERVNGRLTLVVTISPAFQLKQITIELSLSAV